jgi:hypothetical protein
MPIGNLEINKTSVIEKNNAKWLEHYGSGKK